MQDTLDLSRLADRHIRPGWVRTIHSAQGATAYRMLAHLESFRANTVDAPAVYVAITSVTNGSFRLRSSSSNLQRENERDIISLKDCSGSGFGFGFGRGLGSGLGLGFGFGVTFGISFSVEGRGGFSGQTARPTHESTGRNAIWSGADKFLDHLINVSILNSEIPVDSINLLSKVDLILLCP